MFTMEVLTKLLDDSPEYDGKILKRTCLRMYGEMIRGHNMKADALEHMKLLVREAKEAYEAEQAKKAYEAEQATKTLEADQGEKPVHPHKSTERRVPDTEAAIQEIKEEVVNGVPGNPHKSPEGGVLGTEAPIQEDKNVVNGPPGNPHKLPKGGVLDTGAVVQEIKKEVLSGPPLDPHKLPEGRGLDTGAVIQEIKKEVVNGAPGGDAHKLPAGGVLGTEACIRGSVAHLGAHASRPRAAYWVLKLPSIGSRKKSEVFAGHTP